MSALDQVGMLELARQCFAVPAGSSVPHWKTRPVEHFKDDRAAAIFNTAHAGKAAGHVRKEDGRRRIIFKYQGVTVTVYAYQVVWALRHGDWPAADIDHQDNNPSNDNGKNLRLATPSQNLANTGLFAHNASGFKGVSWDRRRSKWRAYIKVNGRVRSLGYHKEIEAAAEAYRVAAKAAFGDFAKVST